MHSIKNLILISLIFGVISGFLAMIPFLCIITILILIFCSSFIIMLIMKKTGMLVCPDEQTGVIYGGISGFIAFIAFSAVAIPLSTLISTITKQQEYAGISMLMSNGISLMFVIVVCIAFLCGMMNAFSGLASVYMFKNSAKNEENPFDLNKFSINTKTKKSNIIRNKKEKSNDISIKNKNNRMGK